MSLNGWEQLSAIYQHSVRRSELPLVAVNTANHSHWLMDVHHNIIDNRIQTDAILLDFQKAFAKVPHQRFLYKLPYYGISPQALNWVQSFLSNRRQAGISTRSMLLNTYYVVFCYVLLIFSRWQREPPCCVNSDAKTHLGRAEDDRQ